LFNFYSMHFYLGREPLKANIDVKAVLFWNVACQGHCDLKNEDSSKSVLKNYTFFHTEIFAFPTLYFDIRTQIYYYLISNHQKPLDWLNLCRNHLWSLFIRSSKVFVLMRNEIQNKTLLEKSGFCFKTTNLIKLKILLFIFIKKNTRGPLEPVLLTCSFIQFMFIQVQIFRKTIWIQFTWGPMLIFSPLNFVFWNSHISEAVKATTNMRGTFKTPFILKSKIVRPILQEISLGKNIIKIGLIIKNKNFGHWSSFFLTLHILERSELQQICCLQTGIFQRNSMTQIHTNLT
jgi:hypothetical protein